MRASGGLKSVPLKITSNNLLDTGRKLNVDKKVHNCMLKLCPVSRGRLLRRTDLTVKLTMV